MSPWLAVFPERWKRLRLRNLVDHVQNGTWGEEPESEDEGVFCIRAADFDRSRNHVDDSRLRRRLLAPAEFQKHRLERGDLVLEKSGGGEQQPVGAAVLYDLDVPAVATNFAARVRPADGVESRFLSYVMASTYELGINQRSIKQTTGIQNLDADSFFSEPWAIPTYAGQRAIADFLDRETARIDALIEKKRRLGGVVAQRATGLAESLIWANPTAERIPLRRVARFVDHRGRTPKKLGLEWGNGDVPAISAMNVEQGRINLEKDVNYGSETLYRSWMAGTEVEKGDVIITTEAPMGHVAQIPDGNPYILSQRVLLLKPRKEMIREGFLAAALGSPSFQKRLEANSTGSTALGIKVDRLKGFKIPVPQLEDQDSVVSRLVAAWDQERRMARALRNQLELLTERRQTLITAAVTGQLDVPRAAA